MENVKDNYIDIVSHCFDKNKDGKDQELIQSSTTPDQRDHMEK